VLVSFEGTGPAIHVRLAGNFMAYDSKSVNLPGVLTTVSGDVLAEIDPAQK
jgi:hypothetical protein